MSIIRNSIFSTTLVLLISVLSGCQSLATQDKTVLPEEAKKSTVIFRALKSTVPPRTIIDIALLLDQYKPDPKRAAELRARLDASPPETQRQYDLAKFYWNRARAAQETGVVARQIADLKMALSLGAAEDSDRINEELASAELRGGNYLDSIEHFKSMQRDYDKTGYQISSRAALARLYVALGDIARAQDSLDHAMPFFSIRKGHNFVTQKRYTWTATFERSHAALLEAEGKHIEAEAAYRKALNEQSKFLDYLRGKNKDELSNLELPYYETAESFYDKLEEALATNLMKQGRLSEAELSIRNVLQRTLSRNGKYSINTGETLVHLSYILAEQQRYREAQTISEIAIEIFSKTGVLSESPTFAKARRAHAATLVAQSKWSEALNEFENMQAALGKDTVLASAFGEGDSNWALALIKTGKPQAAVKMLEPIFESSRQRLGEEKYHTAEVRGFMAIALAQSGQTERALSEFTKAVKILTNKNRGEADGNTNAPARIQRRKLIVNEYIGLLADVQNTDIGRRSGIDVVAEAFRLADESRGGSVDHALAESGARAALNDPRLSQPVRREQDLKNEIAALYGTLINALGTPVDQQSPDTLSKIRDSIAQLSKERKELIEDIDKRFPDYANLINPKPANLDEARAALSDGEAILSILATPERTFVWAVRKTGTLAFVAVPIGEKEINDMVVKLRSSVDPGAIELGDLPEFDLEVAHRFYSSLLAPVESGWKGAHTLLVTTNGKLGQLPLALLPTKPTKVIPDTHLLFAEYRDVPWLAKDIAIVQLPSVNSLVRLRALPAGNPNRAHFIGFGDPQFGTQNPVQVATVTRGVGTRLRNLAIPRTTDQTTETTRSIVDWMDYSQIPPLPDTRDEILSIATALHADFKKDVYLGKEASKKNLLGMNLSQRRIVAFATHGLIPGDFPGLTQPALALAAPDSPEESGLLTLDEILSLKLDADWVVLSACNTAAGDGAGAEAISGLGRGFFYAGSRALLVTHWPVETVSARLLVSGVFERYASASSPTRAEALRQSMLNIMQGQYIDPTTQKIVFAYAHPIFWAPYALFGDGAGVLEK